MIAQEEKLYSASCKNCRLNTQHEIFLIRKTKGVKIRCKVCGLSKFRFTNISKLTEWKATSRKSRNQNPIVKTGDKCDCGEAARSFILGKPYCPKCKIKHNNGNLLIVKEEKNKW